MNSNYSNESAFAQKLSNIFLGQKNIKVGYGYQNIAYVNVRKKSVFFNFPEIFGNENNKKDPFKAMMTFKGLLFHELHHIKHTVNSRKYRRLDQSLRNLIQVLEDGRIETLGVLRYSKLADYFIYSINNVLLKEKDDILQDKYAELINTYILCFGRKLFWQDIDFLEMLRKMIINKYGKDIVEKLEGHIDNYIFEKSSDKRIEIGKQIFDLLYDNNSLPNFKDMKGYQPSSEIDSGRDDPKTMSNDIKEIEAEMEIGDKINKGITKEIQKNTADAKDNSDERKKEIIKTTKDVDKLLEKERESENKLSDAKTDDEWEKAKANLLKVREKMRESRIKERNAKSYNPEGFEDMSLKLSDMMETTEQEQDEIIERNQSDLLQDLKSAGHSLDNLYSDDTFVKTKDMEKLSKQLEKGMKKMNTELVRGYVNKQKSGKLHMRNYLNRKNKIDTKIFRKYIPDRIKDTKILVNIFVDGSGSMDGRDRWGKALDSLWIINESLNKDKNKVMAYQFSHNYKRFKDYDKPLTIPRMIGGGTHPAPAIKDAFPIIEKYKKTNGFKNVIDIIITDGSFDNNESDKMIDKLNNAGHETILIDVGYQYISKQEMIAKKMNHNAKHLINISNFNDLVPELIEIFGKVKKALVMRAKVN